MAQESSPESSSTPSFFTWSCSLLVTYMAPYKCWARLIVFKRQNGRAYFSFFILHRAPSTQRFFCLFTQMVGGCCCVTVCLAEKAPHMYIQ